MPKPDSLVGRMKHLLNTGYGADVHFLVGGGDEKELLPAHKAILSAASDVFEAMFPFDARNADPSQETEPVEVPDVEVGAFKAMLSFIYADDVSGLNGDNALAVLYAANKYDVSGLIKACVDFPKAKLRNVFVALVEGRYLQREDFARRCLEHIDVNVGALILSEEFLQIDQKLLCEILDRDELMINEEIAIWNAALCWADEKCRQNGKEQLSAENRRAMLGPALVKIRFPLISQEDFSEIIVPSGVLTDAEKLSVVLHYLSPDRALPEPYQLKFPTNGRAGTKSGLTLQNRWDSAACHEDLALIEPNRLIVQNTNPLIIQDNGDDEEWCSVLAERPIPTGKFGIFYYEVKILVEKYDFHFGLGTKKMPLDKWVGNYKGTCAYDGSCHFWGHAAEGCSYSYGRPCIDGQPKFGTGDVVGCGINLATRQIFYTMNGKSLDTVDLFVDSALDELFPCVSLLHSGDKIEANFGPNFEYKL